MFRSVIRHPVSVLRTVARDPLDAFAAFREGLFARLEPVNSTSYRPDPDWETRLHRLMGISGDYADEFWPAWRAGVDALRARGFRVGPFSFYGWNDGDAALTRAIWCLIRHLHPSIVVETGVAHGMTSRLILEALGLSGAGNLWSIDLPPYDPHTRKQVGAAVDQERLHYRWNYIAGTSRRRLPALLTQLRRVDLFIHDSMHSAHNMTFELELAWRHLRPGGVMIVDDIDASPAFAKFLNAHPGHDSLVCTAEPLSPDPRRFNHKGLFGIICRADRGSSPIEVGQAHVNRQTVSAGAQIMS
jgi:hypothetical protein